MKITQEQIIYGCIIGIIVCLFGAAIYESIPTPEQREQQRLHNQCVSNAQGSRPHCWSSEDWAAYCQHVECKTQTQGE